MNRWSTIVLSLVMALGAFLQPAGAATFLQPMISAFTASFTTLDRGSKPVHVTTTVTVRSALTKPGYVSLVVKDANGVAVTEYRTVFNAASANSTLQVAGDFQTNLNSSAGAYVLTTTVTSPEANVTGYKSGAFNVTVAASERATYKATLGDLVLNSKSLTPGGHLSYYSDLLPNKATPSSGSIVFTLQNAAKQTIDSFNVKFTSVPLNGFRAARDLVLPTNLPNGSYTVIAVVWSPELNFSRTFANAFQVTNVANGACGSSANTVVAGGPTNICAAGKPSAVAFANNVYTWSCAGDTGGSTASCRAAGPSATCGDSSQQSFANTPRLGLCSTGLASAIQWTPTNYFWSCSDAMSKTQISCSARYVAPTLSTTAYKGAGADGVAAVAQFNGWLGRELDYYMINLNQTNWSALISSTSWAVSSLPQDKRLVVSIPMLVAQDYSGSFWADGVNYKNMVMPKGTLAQGAAGVFDSYFTLMAQTLVKYGRGSAVVRIGWEMNGGWQPWRAAADPASYKLFFQRIVTLMRAVPGANFEFDWCPNIHTQQINPELVYPGDAYVDYIGQDVYDATYNAGDRDPVARWNYFYATSNGIKWMLDFANAHHKKKSFPEWGGGGGYTGNGVGDSAFFINNMAAVIKANGISYAGYWDSNAAYLGQLSNNQYPLMAAAYKAQFGTLAIK